LGVKKFVKKYCDEWRVSTFSLYAAVSGSGAVVVVALDSADCGGHFGANFMVIACVLREL
jgi:hypothetical protein